MAKVEPSIPAFRTFVVVDVVGFGDRRRTPAHQMSVRGGLYELLRTALEGAGILWGSCHVEDRGDGVVIMVPADVPRAAFVDGLPDALVRGLRQYNAVHEGPAQIRLRMALHSGDVRFDAHGVVSNALISAFRLLDSAELRTALAKSDSLLGMVVSDAFYADVVQHMPESQPETYRRVRVAVKELDTTAWIRLPDAPLPPVSTSLRNARCDFLVGFTAADRRWADWIAWHLRDAGYTVELDADLVRPGKNARDRLEGAFDRADRVVVVLSMEFLRSVDATSGAREYLTEASARTLVVQVDPFPSTPLDAVVNIVHDSAETARQRLLAAATPSERAKPVTSPHFPGTPSPIRQPPAAQFPDRDRGERVVVVHAVTDQAFAAEVADSLSVPETEDLWLSVDLRAVGALDEETEQQVDTAVRHADVVLLVVSRELFATGYGTSRELRLAVQWHAERRLTLLPVVLRPTSWETSVFGRLVALPTDGVPVSQWASRDEAIRTIVEAVRLTTRDASPASTPVQSRPHQAVLDLGDVFKQTGVPTLTFVEPDDFFRFRMALRQPGLGVILEGPSGVGKTTLLRRAFAQDADRLGEASVLSARVPADLPKIRKLLDGHTGLVAVDDFQRLSVDLQDRLANYIKALADDDSAQGKLILVGIPDTARGLIEVGFDVATRVKVFRLGRVPESLLLRMVEKGEAALNITFDRKVEIAMASAGSLLTAQMLCLTLAMMAGIEQTTPDPVVVRTDIERARVEVTRDLDLKYRRAVDEFVTLDGSDDVLCVELLLGLAEADDGILPFEELVRSKPDLRSAVERVFAQGLPTGATGGNAEIAAHLFHDPRGRRLVVDDPQFVFYLRQLSRQRLLDIAGKREAAPRDRIFICYSHRDSAWLDRVQVHLRPLQRKGVVDVWSDLHIEAGDRWRDEIATALDQARVAVLLVSADFFASDFIDTEELPPLLMAARNGGCRVVPLLVGPSMFHDVPELAHYQAMPSGRTLGELPSEEVEKTLVELTRLINRTFQQKPNAEDRAVTRSRHPHH
ncbi:TIR domain-containing protein [Saccharothrix longispora]|uniref:TIR domain-containing protein n=1 Tax=Saccharothrix longispora TaxID=33920 RepID=A0ABU1PPD7_9PSEU|nr:TIR domain-containing protein [Saccharothrix longispora]MDR6592532.1 hypothetical protein [Saccharothrix longispora]